jgi:alpha-tubulin suppressor-like RCC1 family protein
MHRIPRRSWLTLAVGLFGVSASLDAGPGAGGGNVHTALLRPDGTVWSAGGNSNGEIGDGTTQTRLARVQVLAGASSLAVGASHTLAVVGSQVYGWGHGTFGQLGDPAAVSRSTPTVSPVLTDVVQVAAGATFGLARHADGTVHVFGRNLEGMGDGTALQPGPPMIAPTAGTYTTAQTMQTNVTVAGPVVQPAALTPGRTRTVIVGAIRS